MASDDWRDVPLTGERPHRTVHRALAVFICLGVVTLNPSTPASMWLSLFCWLVVAGIVVCSAFFKSSPLSLSSDNVRLDSWYDGERFLEVLRAGRFLTDDSDPLRLKVKCSGSGSFLFSSSEPGFSEDAFVRYIETTGPAFDAEAVNVSRLSPGAFRIDYSSQTVLDDLADMQVSYKSLLEEVG